MKNTSSIIVIVLLFSVVSCSEAAKTKLVNVSMTDNLGFIKLDSLIIGNENTKAIMEINDKKTFMIFAPGTNNCYFFKDPNTNKEYNLLSAEGVIFNEINKGPIKFSLFFEKFDKGIKIINLIGGKEALIAGQKTIGFYNINLEK